mgnify:CR=1 FL=1
MALNAIKSLMGIIFPLISFPYVAKTLNVVDLGQYNFASSVIGYFALFAQLGISSYAVREGAGIRDNKEKLKKFCEEIFSINMLATVGVYIVFFICLLAVPKFHGYTALLLTFSVQIIFTTIGTEWIFGIYEDYLFLTIRSIVIQILSIVLLFVFVRKRGDVIPYALVTVMANVGANLVNGIYAQKKIRFGLITSLNLKHHLKPILIIFSTALACTIYVNSDVTVLGFISSDYNVGLYSVSTKIYTVLKTVATSTLMVAIPRLSYYIANNMQHEYNKQLKTILQTVIVLIVPVTVGVIMLRREVILILADESYMEAVESLVILCATLPICVLATFVGQCILMPFKEEEIIFRATMVSAVVNLALNLILIPFFAQNAAAFTTLLAEATALIIQAYYARKYVKLTGIFKTIRNTTLGSIAIVICCILLRAVHLFTVRIVADVVVSVITYLVILMLLKEEGILFLLRWTRKRKNKKNDRNEPNRRS